MFIHTEGSGIGGGAPRQALSGSQRLAYWLGLTLGRAVVSLMAYMTKRPPPRPPGRRQHWLGMATAIVLIRAFGWPALLIALILML